jgi:protein-L-isoaspartate O-methyltransferase
MTASLRRALVLVAALLLLAAGPPAATAQLPGTSPTADTTDKDVPYVPTAPSVVTRMLEVADVSETDVVYDLGSGDGRIPIAAAEQFGARAFGVEIDSGLVAKARASAREAGVEDLVTFRRGDLFNVDLHDATVVTLYLWPEINVRLRPKLLQQLDPGDRIVSHDFRMGDWEPDRVVDAGQGNTGEETIYLWIVPENVPADLLDISDEPEVN